MMMVAAKRGEVPRVAVQGEGVRALARGVHGSV